MNDSSMVEQYNLCYERLLDLGINVTAYGGKFHIYFNGRNIADVYTVDGLRGFLQACEWNNEETQNIR